MTSPRTWFQQVINTDATAGSTCAGNNPELRSGDLTVRRPWPARPTLPATLTCDRPG